MAAMGVDAVATFVRTGRRPTAPQGREFVDTGTVLVTDQPVAGIESIDSRDGLAKCWG
jgi:fructose transport system substrate-binding protein